MYNHYLLEQLVKVKQLEIIQEIYSGATRPKGQWSRLVRMSHRQQSQPGSHQLLYIFLGQLSILFVGMGVFPILPIYAGGFESSPAMISLYLALVSVSITLGSLLTGWMAGRISRRAQMAAAGSLGVAALALLGQAQAFWHVVVLTSLVWFTGGVGLGVLSVFTGLHAGAGQRGRWFSLTALSTPLGAVIGSLAVGRLVQAGGYGLMFASLAVVYSLWPVLGWFKIQEKNGSAAPSIKKQAAPVKTGKGFGLLLGSALLVGVTLSINRLGISLSMEANQFPVSAIADANMVGGIVTIPLVLWLGTLSDRFGRKFFLAAGSVLSAAAAAALLGSSLLWQFSLITALTLITRTVVVSLSPALAADMMEGAALERGLPRLNTMQWVAGVVGYVVSGGIIQAAGTDGLYALSVVLGAAAAVMVVLLPVKAGGAIFGSTRIAPAKLAPAVRLPQSAASTNCGD